jgi:hypothetical protein
MEFDSVDLKNASPDFKHQDEHIICGASLIHLDEVGVTF